MSNELYHHGVKGMKWGVRRYQNADGTLTNSGKKKISKAYKKASIDGDEDLKKSYNSMYIKSYNKAADEMNNGGIAKFNESQNKKYGPNYAKRAGYEDDYMKLFDSKFRIFMNTSMLEFRDANKHYQKADDLVKKYSMTSWDALAKSNQEGIDHFRKALE